MFYKSEFNLGLITEINPIHLHLIFYFITDQSKEWGKFLHSDQVSLLIFSSFFACLLLQLIANQSLNSYCQVNFAIIVTVL